MPPMPHDECQLPKLTLYQTTYVRMALWAVERSIGITLVTLIPDTT